MDRFKAEQDIPPLQDIIEGIADLMDRALTPAGGGNSEAGKVIIKQLAETTRHQFEKLEKEKRSEY